MPIDSSIYSQIRQPEQFNPLAEAAQAQQLQGMQNTNRLAALGFQDRERAINDAATQREAVRGFGADTGANYNKLLQTGNLPAAQDYMKKVQEQKKTASEISAKDFETASKRLDVAGQAFGFVLKNPTLENAMSTIGYLEQNGILPPEQAQQYRQTVQSNPQAVGQLAEQAHRSTLSAKDQLGQIKITDLGATSQTQSIDPVSGQVTQLASAPITQSANSIATQETTRRGQNMVDTRAREATQAGGVPSGYRRKPDGALEFIPGGPADPATAKRAAPTEFQGKSAAFGGRAREADRIIQELEGKYSPAAVNTKQALGNVWGIGGALEAGANVVLSDEGQKAEQAQRDFVNALLRQESGAAIGKDEFDNARRQYFPQPGDGAEVLKQKASNRQLAIKGLLNNAGNATVPTNSGGWTVEVDR